jgi:hypothetical protein
MVANCLAYVSNLTVWRVMNFIAITFGSSARGFLPLSLYYTGERTASRSFVPLVNVKGRSTLTQFVAASYLSDREAESPLVNKEGLMQDTEVSSKIATLNDTARRNVMSYMTSAGVISLEPSIVGDIYTAVYNYRKFTEDNDPYGEHDFGSFKIHGQKIFWKIDYYDQQLQYWCDPLDPECRRVVTIMLAEEY